MFSRLASATAKKGVAYKSVFGKSVAAGLVGAGTFAGFTAYASEDHVPPQHLHWSHDGFTGSYDTASLRRGYEVYRQVCSTCHSMDIIHFRELVGVTHTEEQAKALAFSYEIKDGPNDEGEFFERPGKLSDHFPAPYPNTAYARFANGGALPPDLSCIAKARHSGSDYIFHLLTGYKEPPAGVVLREGLHYNPYFAGGAISMAPPLQDEGIDFEDGTPATCTQMAKDVATFLTWCSEPEADERKKMGIKMCGGLAVMIGISGYFKRFKWSIFKTRRISWID